MEAPTISVQDLPDGSDVTVPEQINEIRNQLLDKSLIVVAALAVPIVLVSLSRAASTGWQPIMYLHVFIGILIPVIIILRRRLTLRVRAAIIFGSLFLAGVGGLLTYGLIGAGILILATVCLAFTIIYGLRIGVLFLIASILIIATTGIAAYMGLITFAVDFNVYAITASSWITAASTFALFVGFFVLISGLFSQYLEDAVTVAYEHSMKLQQTNKELIEEFKAHQLAEKELIKSEEKLSKAFQATPDAVAITRLSDGMIIYANKAFAEYAKLPSEKSLGKTTLDLNIWVDPEDRVELMKRLKEEDEVRNFEIDLRAKDGEIKPMSMAASLIEIDGEKCMVSLSRDISDRKQAEEALNESESKYRTLFEKSADAILIIEGDKFVDCNTATVEMLGYKNKEKILETHPSELSPELQPDGRNSIEKANEILSTFDQGSIRFEWDHKRKNGEVFPVEVVMTAVPIGERKFFHVVWRDITERKRLEASLQESNERFRAAFADAAVGMILVSPDHSIIEANQSFCNMLGYSREELVGILFKDITHPDDVDSSLDYHHKLIAGEIDKYYFEKRYLHKRGHEIWGLLSVSLVRDKDAAPLYTIAQIQDITDRKQAENELHQYQMQLRALASEITIAEEQERRRIAIELHDYIIQDLGLSKIKLGELVQRLSTDDCLPLAEETRELIEGIIKESRSLVFELSLPVLYDLGYVAAIKWLAEQTERKLNIPCKVQDDGQPKPMNKDMQVLLFKAVRELINNISKHAHANEINILINRVNGQINTSVQDDGVGFDPAHIELYRGEALKFGLFGIKERLNLLNGLVKISLTPGSGTNITLTAPLEIDD